MRCKERRQPHMKPGIIPDGKPAYSVHFAKRVQHSSSYLSMGNGKGAAGVQSYLQYLGAQNSEAVSSSVRHNSIRKDSPHTRALRPDEVYRFIASFSPPGPDQQATPAQDRRLLERPYRAPAQPGFSNMRRSGACGQVAAPTPAGRYRARRTVSRAHRARHQRGLVWTTGRPG